ncbi:MAG: hypothetical protein JO128_20525 [Alphaproteobacteria bacterium]|nr:hypothetical protein [Alphaproteobacteria bacterium]
MGWGHIGVIFGLAGMAFGFTAMCFAFWHRQRRETAALEVLRTYATQGNEPPPEVTTLLQGTFRRNSRARDLRLGVFFACLAAAFVVNAYFGSGIHPHHGFLFPTALFAALAVYYAVSGLFLRRDDQR